MVSDDSLLTGIVFPRITCNDGFELSVQAREFTYCTPRSNTGPWTEVEVGFPSAVESLLLPFAEDSSKPTETVYGWVPLTLVKRVVAKHGGTGLSGRRVLDIMSGKADSLYLPGEWGGLDELVDVSHDGPLD